jgi:hypothetical protein
MKWVTRERVKVDRVACPWLIKKFVDPQAEFHGQECSFEAIVKKYDLGSDPALVLLAKIVNGADTDNAAEWVVYDALYAYCQEMVRRGKPTGPSSQPGP